MNQDQIERELQFEAPDLESVQAWLNAQPSHAAIAIELKDDKTQQDTYLDTAGWAIFNTGYSLRLRHLSEASEATLKALGKRVDGPQQRREVNQTITGTEAWAADAGPVSERVRLMTGGAALQTLFNVETRRRNYNLCRDGSVLAELSLDDAAIRRGEQTLDQLHRVEVEEKRDGGLAAVDVLVEALRGACALEPAGNSKFEAGLAAARLNPQESLDYGYAELAANASAGEYAYALLRRYFRDVLRHEPGTRLGEDIEELHDMRVAVRRLRAGIKTFATVLPLRFETYRTELQWVGQSLGKVRDLDVQLEWLDAVRQSSDWGDSTALGPLLAELQARRSGGRTELLGVLDSERYRTLVRELGAALREGETASSDAGLAVRVLGAKVLRKRYKQFREESKGLTPESAAGLYHSTRIRGKGLRYALEGLQAVFGRDGARMAAAAKAVQDLLGELQDSSVTITWLRDMAASHGAGWPPTTVLRMGELLEQRRARMEAIRVEWPDALDEVKKRWKPLEKSMREKPKAQPDEDASDAEPIVQPAVQRPFSLLQRFFRRGDD